MSAAYSSSKARRITKRVAIAAALALVPTAFVVAPALAATPHPPAGVRSIDDDWGHGGPGDGGWGHDRDGWGHGGWGHDHDGWGHGGWGHDRDGWGHGGWGHDHDGWGRDGR